jgi:predicted Fe-S protein YdhL (DUF1289 family)
MQLSLNFLQTPRRPEAAVWERLDDQQRQAIVARLAQLITKVAVANAVREADDD